MRLFFQRKMRDYYLFVIIIIDKIENPSCPPFHLNTSFVHPILDEISIILFTDICIRTSISLQTEYVIVTSTS